VFTYYYFHGNLIASCNKFFYLVQDWIHVHGRIGTASVTVHMFASCIAAVSIW